MKKAALYVSDLDGTLLQKDGHLSAFAHEALCDFVRDGVPFTVASGRTFASIHRALGHAPVGLPVISSDGALISRSDDPRPLYLFPMDPDGLNALNASLLDRGLWPILDVWDGQENVWISPGLNNFVMEGFHAMKLAERFYRYRFETVRTIPATWQGISLTLLDTPERLLPVRQEIDQTLGHLFKTDYAVLDDFPGGAALWIQHAKARKEHALQELTRMLGIEEGHVVVFGDELNDLGMFGREWHAVAVSNARQELKDKAREVIGHHTDDVVAKYIKSQN